MGHGSCYYEVPVALFSSVQFLKSGFLYYISYLPVFFSRFLQVLYSDWAQPSDIAMDWLMYHAKSALAL